jgi:uncharacterized protein YuzE
MKISYDPRYNIAYIQLREKTNQIETLRISDELNIDISSDGKIYGIELLNANEQLQIKKGGEFVLIDESTHKTVKLPIPACALHADRNVTKG